MKIVETKKNADFLLAVSGRLDTNTAPQLEQKINEVLPQCVQLSVDLSKVEYISSAGLRVVLAAHKAAGRGKHFVIKNPSEFCIQVFEATGMKSILTIQ